MKLPLEKLFLSVRHTFKNSVIVREFFCYHSAADGYSLLITPSLHSLILASCSVVLTPFFYSRFLLCCYLLLLSPVVALCCYTILLLSPFVVVCFWSFPPPFRHSRGGGNPEHVLSFCWKVAVLWCHSFSAAPLSWHLRIGIPISSEK